MGTSVSVGRNMVRIRASLQDVEPEVWRLLDVDAEMTLEDLHTVLQVAFGWRQYHLHGFAQEESSRGERRLRRYWRDERSLVEGMTGVPEADARVGDVFAETRPSIEYEYDFGDGWTHVLEWVDTCAGEPGEPCASLVRAQGSAPWEDSGGASGYIEKREACDDPAHPDHAETMRWVEETSGPWRVPDGAPPDVEAITRELTRQFPLRLADDAATDGGAAPRRPTAIDALTEIMADGWVPEFRMYLDRAGADLDSPDPAAPAPDTSVVEATVVETAVRPYRWLLGRVGPEGLRLTSAGWLPPAVVVEALAELDWRDREVGAGNREDRTNTVFDLRQTAMALGLLRVQKGMLLLTPAGRKVAPDAEGLWRYLARAVVERAGSDVERDASLFFAVEVAAGRNAWDADYRRDPYGDAVAYALETVGWVSKSGAEVDAYVARDAASLVAEVFEILGAWERNSRTRRGAVTEAGRAFAREILALPADLARHRSRMGSP